MQRIPFPVGVELAVLETPNLNEDQPTRPPQSVAFRYWLYLC